MKDTFTVPSGLHFEGRQTIGTKTLLLFTELDESMRSYGATFTVAEKDAERSSFSIVEKRAWTAAQYREDAA